MTKVTIIESAAALGDVARNKREALSISLRVAAPAGGVGVRFLSEFERGKPTSEIGKVLGALHAVDLDLAVVPRQTGVNGYSRLLDTEFPYDWSNAKMDAQVFIRKVLNAQRFNDILKIVGYFGMESVADELPLLNDEVSKKKIVSILSRIQQGLLLCKCQYHAES